MKGMKDVLINNIDREIYYNAKTKQYSYETTL